MTGPGEVTEALRRLAAQYPDWRVYPVYGEWSGWAAFNGETGQMVSAPTLPQLECELAGR